MGKFEILDHTADIGMIIIGDNPDDFFLQAFKGFLELAELDHALVDNARERIPFELSANDMEELLVKFLNELIRLLQEDVMSPVAIDSIHCDRTSLKCVISASKIIEHPDGCVEMKAATYHMLNIKEKDGILSTPCIIDI